MVRPSGLDFYYDKFALCLAFKIRFLTQIALDQMLFDYLNQYSCFFKKLSSFPNSAICHIPNPKAWILFLYFFQIPQFSFSSWIGPMRQFT